MRKRVIFKYVAIISIIYCGWSLNIQSPSQIENEKNQDYRLLSVSKTAFAQGETACDYAGGCKRKFCSLHNNYNYCTFTGDLDPCSE